MNETEYLLTVLSEECAEVVQRASKAARFGLSEIQPGQNDDNRRRLERELADLMATADLLGLRVRDEDKAAKIEKLKKFMDYSREVGTLEDRSKQDLQVEGVRNGIIAAAEALQNQSRQECHRQLMLILGTIESSKIEKRKEEVGVFCLDHRKVMANGICPKCCTCPKLKPEDHLPGCPVRD